MHFVYILKSNDDQHWYVGLTADIDRRLLEHNNGRCIHTNKFRPWKLYGFIALSNRKKAEEFEQYLKSHSGRAFAKKHFGS